MTCKCQWPWVWLLVMFFFLVFGKKKFLRGYYILYSYSNNCGSWHSYGMVVLQFAIWWSKVGWNLQILILSYSQTKGNISCVLYCLVRCIFGTNQPIFLCGFLLNVTFQKSYYIIIQLCRKRKIVCALAQLILLECVTYFL